MIPPPPTSTLFPYTTLFRSIRPHLPAVVAELHGLPPFLGLPHPRGDPRRVHAPLPPRQDVELPLCVLKDRGAVVRRTGPLRLEPVAGSLGAPRLDPRLGIGPVAAVCGHVQK